MEGGEGTEGREEEREGRGVEEWNGNRKELGSGTLTQRCFGLGLDRNLVDSVYTYTWSQGRKKKK